MQPDDGGKRRRIRKGTRSCWSCKNRKSRCVYAIPTDTVCVGCSKRGSRCVSQEFPEEQSTAVDRSRQIGDRILRVEALVEQIVKGAVNGPLASDPSNLIPRENTSRNDI